MTTFTRIFACVIIFFVITPAFSADPYNDDIFIEPTMTSGKGFWQKFGAGMRNYWLNTPDSTRHREYARVFETGGGISAGIALDTYLGFLDVFKKGADVHIDFNEMLNYPSSAFLKGLNINAEAGFTLLYFRMKHPRLGNFGFSFLNIDSRLDINFNEDFISFFAKGNIENHNIAPEITISGALFAEIFAAEFRRRIFTHYFVTLRPSWYVPVFYIPMSVQKLQISADNGFKAEISGGANVYLPFSTENGFQITSLGGLDTDFIIERPIFNILDVGLELLHLPLMPAVLSNVSEIGFDGTLVNISGATIDNTEFKMPELGQFYHTKNFWAPRPITTGLYLLYRPFGNDRWIVRPNFSLTFFNPSGQLYINGGIETTFMASGFFEFTFGTGMREGLARNSLKLALNWRHFGLYLKLDLRSQDYLRSWTFKGAGLSLGWYAGR